MTRSDLPVWVQRLQPSDLALGWLTVRTSEPFAVIEAASAGGFGAVGLKFAPRIGEEPPALMTDTGLQSEIGAELRRRGLTLLNLGSIWLDGSRPVEWFRPAIAGGAAMGARFALGISLDGERPRQARQFAELADLCAEHQVDVALEFFAYSALRSIEEAAAVIFQAGRPNLRLLIDALHFARSGGTAAKVRQLDPNSIGYFQLCDAPATAPPAELLSNEGGKDRLDPGEGGLELADYLAALPRPVPIEVEIPRLASASLTPADRGREAAERSLAYLRKRSILTLHGRTS